MMAPFLEQREAVSTKQVNHDWLHHNFPCRQACPVHTEAGRYVALIAEGRYEEAYYVARKPNPFASICGRICAAPCEAACRRGTIDQPIAIRALKRFVCERYGVESMIDIGKIRQLLGPSLKKRKERVAVVGAGPAGLSAAHDLALMGYSVTVFEARSVPGGMLRLGVPEYRLPRELLRLEINLILGLGVDLQLNATVGKDFTLNDLKQDGFEAVFLAVGAHKSRDLRIDGVDFDGVLRAVDFLLNVNLGYRVDLGQRVIVIGGGNVAFDVARTVVRQEEVTGLQPATDLIAALDAARSAVRFGAREVHLVCLESWKEMPASQDEIDEALEERIQIHPSLGPKRILSENGRASGLETLDVASVFDAQGRFNPTFVPGTERIMEADTIIMAIGQAPDLSFLRSDDNVEITPRGLVKIDPGTLATTADGIFAGGDVAFGARIAIEAVANGRQAARSIDAYLNGPRPRREQVFITTYDTKTYQMPPGYDAIPRQPIPAVPIDRRIGIAQVELGYTEDLAVHEASRCLHCWVNTIFEPSPELGLECIACGGCVDVCPENCIDLVSLARVGFDSETHGALAKAFPDATSVFSEIESVADGAMLIKDEERCIRCGLCAKRCPVGFITMQGYEMIEVDSDEGDDDGRYAG